MRNKRNATIAAVVSAVVFIVCGWLLLRGGTSLETFPLNTLKPQGDKAEMIFDLVLWVFGIAAVVFVLVESGILWMAYRFRRDPSAGRDGAGSGAGEDDDAEPVQLHGNPRLEIAWTIVPALLLAVLAVFNVQTILRVEDVSDDALEVNVVGQQWWWEYRYDTNDDGVVDIITANQLVIPAGRDVDLSIQSNDVIHSFWIPALNGKKDAVPGRTHSLVLQAWEPGIYEGQCTEFCGLSHGVMRMQVKALSAGDYAEWVKKMTTVPEEPATEPAKAGQEIFVQQCSGCHQVNGIDPGATAPYSYAKLPDPEYGESVDSPLLSKNAPNLTHLMMRDTFAGSLLELYEDPATPVVENPGKPNVNNLKRWLRNPEDIKPMNPANNQGMPDLGLSEEQIDQVVAYLITLK